MVIRKTTLCLLTALAVLWVAAPVGAEEPSQPAVGAEQTPKPGAMNSPPAGDGEKALEPETSHRPSHMLRFLGIRARRRSTCRHRAETAGPCADVAE